MEDYQNLIEYYVEKKLEGTDYSAIRKELKQKNVADELIKRIIRDVDKIVINEELNKNSEGKGKEIYYAGLFLTALGLVVTLGTYSGLINIGNSFIILYGPFFGGISLIMYSKQLRKPANRRKLISMKRRNSINNMEIN